jgi:hypothetical protein
MAGRSCGGAPARRGARKEGREVEWACMSARVSPWGAQGCASSREGDMASESCCWQAGGHVALGARRRDVERRGEGQHGSGERRARRWRGTWRREEWRGAAGARESGRRRRRSGAERNREREGLEVEDKDLSAVFQKCRDSTVMPN